MNLDPRTARVWSPWASILLIWGGTITTALLVGMITRTPLPGLLPVLVARPLSVMTIMVVMALLYARITRVRFDQSWQRLLSIFPFACVLGVLMGVLGIWNDGSGTVALPLRDLGLFIVTLGIFPLKLGPDALVRGIIIGLSILSLSAFLRRGTTPVRAVVAGLLAWIVSASILLIQSWMAIISATFRTVSLQHALDASRVLGAVHANSYWSSFQADRFFSGIGNQLETNILFSASAVTFLILVVGIICLAGFSLRANLKALLGLARRLFGQAFCLFASAAAAGAWLGMRGLRLNWNGPDIVSFAVAAVVFIAWFAWWLFGRDLEDLAIDEREHPERPLPSGLVSPDEMKAIRDTALALTLGGAFLLGWPALFTILVLLSCSWMASIRGFGWASSPRLRIPVWAGLALAAAAFGGTVGVRSLVLPPSVFGVAIAWASLALLMKGFTIIPPSPRRRLFVPGLIMATAFLMSLALGSWVVLAAAALVSLISVWLERKQDFWLRYGFFLILILGWTATALRYALP